VTWIDPESKIQTSSYVVVVRQFIEQTFGLMSDELGIVDVLRSLSSRYVSRTSSASLI